MCSLKQAGDTTLAASIRPGDGDGDFIVGVHNFSCPASCRRSTIQRLDRATGAPPGVSPVPDWMAASLFGGGGTGLIATRSLLASKRATCFLCVQPIDSERSPLGSRSEKSPAVACVELMSRRRRHRRSLLRRQEKPKLGDQPAEFHKCHCVSGRRRRRRRRWRVTRSGESRLPGMIQPESVPAEPATNQQVERDEKMIIMMRYRNHYHSLIVVVVV